MRLAAWPAVLYKALQAVASWDSVPEHPERAQAEQLRARGVQEPEPPGWCNRRPVPDRRSTLTIRS